MKISRRDLLKTASAAGAFAVTGLTALSSYAKKSSSLPINMAGYDYDRVQALIDGSVEIKGCNTSFEVSRIGELNTHIFSGPQTRKVTEVGLQPLQHAEWMLLSHDNPCWLHFNRCHDQD